MTGPSCHRRLVRYWFPLPKSIGVGVTAASEEEARALADSARARYFPDEEFVGIVPDMDVRTLDPERVIPNMGLAIVRGVWYPRLNL